MKFDELSNRVPVERWNKAVCALILDYEEHEEKVELSCFK